MTQATTWTEKCAISPAGLVLGALYDGPRTVEELMELADRIWPESESLDGPVCHWHARAKTAAAVNYFVRNAMVYVDEQGLLHLRKQLLHPMTREIARRARDWLASQGLL